MMTLNVTIRRGFTLIELMVVIVILGLVASLLIVTAGSISSTAKSSKDSSNLRAIARANASHAIDNKERLFSPRTEPHTGTGPDNPSSTVEQIRRMWVHAFNDNVDDLGNSRIEIQAALTKGAAWEYLGDATAYKSPLDSTERIRSYSLNAFIGVDRCADEYPQMSGVFVPAFNTRYRVACRTSADIPQPGMTICAIGEVDFGQAGYAETSNINGWLVSPNPNMPIWKDTPALLNGNRVNISLMDGSVDTIVLQQAELIRNKVAQTGSSHNIMIGATDQDKVDFQAFNSRLLPGVLNYRTAADQE